MVGLCCLVIVDRKDQHHELLLTLEKDEKLGLIRYDITVTISTS